MGDILKGLGKKKAAKSLAKSYDYATDEAKPYFDRAAAEFDPYIQPGVNANDATADLLGVGGDPAQAQAAFQNYLNSSGYQFRLKSGGDAITGNNAAKGLLNSGATATRLLSYGQDLGSEEFGNYLGQLGGVADRGYGASANRAQATANTGNFLFDARTGRGQAAAGGKGVLLNAGGNAINSLINMYTKGKAGLDSTSGTGY